MSEQNNQTVESAAVAYLGSLSAARRAENEAAVQRFVRWVGRGRPMRGLTPLDIDAFSRTATPADGTAIRGFLSYAYKKRFIPRGLASHVKVKKESAGPARAAAADNSEPIHVTPEGLASLKSELEELRKERVTVTEQMRKAAADKDFRENAPLHAAREQKSHIEGRIQEIESTLARATVGQTTKRTAVGLHDTVRLTDLDSGTAVEYRLVDSREANPAKGRISTASPIGRAVLGRQPGDEFEFAAPAGTFKYRVEKVEQEE